MRNVIKKILGLFLLSVLLSSTQCSKTNEDRPPVLEVEPTAVSFVQKGETKTVVIVANNEWSAGIPNEAKEWLSSSGSDNLLSITAREHTGDDIRKTTVTITSGGLSENVDITQFGLAAGIIPSISVLQMDYEKNTYELLVSSNVAYKVVIDDDVDWLKEVNVPDRKTSGLTDKTHYFECTPNYTGALRETTIDFIQTDGEITATVKVQQKSYGSEPDPSLQGDIKIPVKNAWASSAHGQDPVTKAIDGDMETIWHSTWGTSTWPITAVFYFENAGEMDYLIYYPRSDGGSNGNFKEFNLYISYKENPNRDAAADWELYGQYDFSGSASPTDITFSPALENPTAIKFEVLSGTGDNENGFASCAEMEFYRNNPLSLDLSHIFTDHLFSGIKPGITESDILNDSEIPPFFKNLALQLLAGNYSPFRIQDYEAYRPVADLAKEFKTSEYNKYENPTGIWMEEGKEMYVFVDDTRGEKVSLISRNWTTDQTGNYLLKTGMNQIKPTSTGQAYISYFTGNYKTALPVKIHIAGGKINGYFDRNKHTAEEWQVILNDAAGDHLDIVGNYTNCVFHIPSLKTNCPRDGMRLIQLYDEIIEIEFEQMGLFKYQKVPKNHMLGRNMPSGYMHADGLGAAFHNNTMNSVGNPDVIVTGDNSWGIAHEYGHVNQIRPGLKWVGTAECTNNIYSSYIQYLLTSKYATLHLRLEHENCLDIEGGEKVIGGRFNSHLHYGVLKGNNWLFQQGQDGTSDHFVKLVPMWQLNLYFKVAKEAPWYRPDWFGDICEETRTTNDAGFTNGQHQINFMKRACKYTKTDLIDFFEKAGMLKPIDVEIDDYGKQNLKITQAMCDEVVKYVRDNGWQKPDGIINYISGNTIKIYENRLPVQGVINQGINGSGTSRVVSHHTWKNAVVYETYAGEEVVRITMAGTGTTDNSSTKVPYPAGATKIVAVAWDGTRTTVYQP
ncbi:MAG: M60 family metallopeptidase [Bacteroidales bacterium]|jgi:hypothetical protein|nr:M60 family metallopeptidase [Bacteroidales bacterium]